MAQLPEAASQKQKLYLGLWFGFLATPDMKGGKLAGVRHGHRGRPHDRAGSQRCRPLCSEAVAAQGGWPRKERRWQIVVELG